jgi:hypothetical protein
LGSLNLGTDLDDRPLSSPVITEYRFVHRDDTLGDLFLPRRRDRQRASSGGQALRCEGGLLSNHRGRLASPSTRDLGSTRENTRPR